MGTGDAMLIEIGNPVDGLKEALDKLLNLANNNWHDPDAVKVDSRGEYFDVTVKPSGNGVSQLKVRDIVECLETVLISVGINCEAVSGRDHSISDEIEGLHFSVNGNSNVILLVDLLNGRQKMMSDLVNICNLRISATARNAGRPCTALTFDVGGLVLKK